jgi:hypothetical protein
MVKTKKGYKTPITHKRKKKSNINNKQNNKTYKHKKTKIYRRKGGKVIDSGGFGCVFDPALQCKETGLREQGKISKLMRGKNAVEELNIINNIKDKLSIIPNYRDYFLVDGATLCKPSPLTENDLVDFNEKCTALPKRKVSKMTINRADVLSDLTVLNLPNGGLSLSKFIENNASYEAIYKIQVALLQLLKNGIIPMNSNHIYHNDIKASNILVDTTDNTINNTFKIRLIDWGFLTEYVPRDQIPIIWKSLPLTFNEPFSVILFSDKFYSDYANFILEYNNYNKFNNVIDLFLNDYIYNKETSGHFNYIMKIFYMLYKNNLPSGMSLHDKEVKIERVYALPQIRNYLKQILLNFTKKIFASKDVSDAESIGSLDISSASETDSVNNGEQAFISIPSVDNASSSQNNQPNSSFNSLNAENIFIDIEKQTAMANIIKMELKIYLDSVFIKNVDIWGFIMCYMPIIKMLSDTYGLLNKLQKELFEALKRLIILYLFLDPNEPILEKANFYETLDNITLLLQQIITP